ncbi:MAG: hypothetical protein PHS97_01545 [Oscillospiraceae bacterium]|nr:hypothetical protein [Oscillospiraceae bacterium]
MTIRALPLTLAAAILFVLLILALAAYFGAYCRAMAPKRGTLEWIALYDAAPLSFSGLRSRLHGRDAVALGLLALGLISCAVMAVMDLLLPTQATLATPLGNTFFPLVAVLAPTYLLLRALLGSSGFAWLGTAVVACNCSPYSGLQDTSAVWLVCAFALLYCWLTTDYDARLRKTLPPILLGAAALPLAAFSNACALSAIGAWLVLFFIGLGLRFVRRRRPGRLADLIFTLIFAALAVAAAVFALLMAIGAANRLAFPDYLRSAAYYRSVFSLLRQSAVFSIHFQTAATLSFLNPLLFWGSLFAVCALFTVCLSRHDARPLFLTLAYLGLLPTWLMTGSPAFTALASAALCMVFQGFANRGHGFAAGLYAAMTLLLSLACSVTLWLH